MMVLFDDSKRKCLNLCCNLILKITESCNQIKIIEEVGSSGYALLIGLARFQVDEEYLEISNDELKKLLSIKTDAGIIKLRKLCIDAGFIDYNKGKPRQVGSYKINTNLF